MILLPDTLACLLFSAGGYLIGSVPTGYLVTRLLRQVDIRKLGSGNIGATNVARVVGFKAGLFVLVCDILKGTLPVAAARILHSPSRNLFSAFFLIIGIAAILGHAFPIFLKGKGGKAVATSFGVIIALSPAAAAAAFGVWLVVFLITRFVSAASMLAAFSLPFFIALFGKDILLQIITAVLFLFITWRHKENIRRILNGTEHRVTLSWRTK